tara:strand:- start:1221 stop:2492 length:1272 start_codon:yes stop_codon:yes gene_type:complete
MDWREISKQLDRQIALIDHKTKQDLLSLSKFEEIGKKVTGLIVDYNKKKANVTKALDFFEDIGGKYDDSTGNIYFDTGEEGASKYLQISKKQADYLFNKDAYASAKLRTKGHAGLVEILTAGQKASEKVYGFDQKVPSALKSYKVHSGFEDVEFTESGIKDDDTSVVKDIDRVEELFANQDIIRTEIWDTVTSSMVPAMITPNEQSLIKQLGGEKNDYAVEIWMYDRWKKGGKKMVDDPENPGTMIRAYDAAAAAGAVFSGLSYLGGIASKTRAAKAKERAMKSALKKLPGMQHSLRQKIKDMSKTAEIQTEKFENQLTDISAQTETGYAEVMRSLDDIGRKQGALTSGETERMIDENLAATLYAGESALESTEGDISAFNLQVDQQETALADEQAALQGKEREWRRQLKAAGRRNAWYKNLL